MMDDDDVANGYYKYRDTLAATDNTTPYLRSPLLSFFFFFFFFSRSYTERFILAPWHPFAINKAAKAAYMCTYLRICTLI